LKPHRARSYTLLRTIAFLVITSLLTVSAFSFAQAGPAELTQAQKDAQQLRALIDQLDDELSKADEDYNYAAQQLKDTQAAKAKTQNKLKKTQSQLEDAQSRLMDRLADIYKAGRGSALEVLVDATSLSDLVNRARDLNRVSQQDSELVSQIEDYLTSVKDQKADLAQQEKDEKAQVAKLAQAKKDVEAQLAAQEKALKGKETQIAQLREEERARQAELAAAAKAAAEAAALREASVSTTERTTPSTAKSTTKTTTKTTTKNSTTTTKPKSTTTTDESTSDDSPSSGGTSNASGSRAELIDVAMRYLGVPYVWAGSSPSGFDCSGFVMYVFSKIGVQLPHSSAMQYNCGTHVSKSELKPGDLVFFYSPIHHVGIYIGDGQMINSRSGGVQIESAFWSSYAGATRILN
jgi:peptidoglycan DL-endopeptidase CwlO